MKLFAWICLLALAAITITGCAGKPPPPPAPPPPPPAPTRVVVSLEAVGDLNPDPQGRPSPLVLRLYQLKSTGAFDSADFFSLYEKDSAALGADLVAREEILVKPGESTLLERTLEDQTRHLGFLAAYRDLDRAVWRATVPVPPNLTTPVKIELQRTAISARVESLPEK